MKTPMDEPPLEAAAKPLMDKSACGPPASVGTEGQVPVLCEVDEPASVGDTDMESYDAGQLGGR